MLAIRQVEVKPEAWDYVGAGVGTAVIGAWETVWALECYPKVHGVLCAQRGRNFCYARERSLSKVEPLGAGPTFSFGINVSEVRVRLRKDQPALLDVRVELLKEALDLGGVWLCRHLRTPSS